MNNTFGLFGLVGGMLDGRDSLVIACAITQKDFSLFEGASCLADRVPCLPYELQSSSAPAEFAGRVCLGETVFGAAKRSLTPEERVADAIFVTAPPGPGGISAMIAALRADGFRGAILSPGLVTLRPDNPPGARDVCALIERIIVQSPAL